MKRAMITAVSIIAVGIAAVICWYLYATMTVERPDYATVVRDGDIEIRDYPPLRVAQVTMQGSRREAVNKGFSPLAGYIFASERDGPKIAMTAPVTQNAASDDAQSWTIRFIMPSQYETIDALPLPAGSSGVKLAEQPAMRMAAIRFSGVADDRSIARQEEALRAWLAERGIEAAGPPVYAYYNDPFTPGPLRRNEVLMAIPEDAQ